MSQYYPFAHQFPNNFNRPQLLTFNQTDHHLTLDSAPPHFYQGNSQRIHKNSEGNISFGDCDEKQAEIQLTAKKEQNYEQWSPGKAIEKKQDKGSQQIEDILQSVKQPHNTFSLKRLRQKAGLAPQVTVNQTAIKRQSFEIGESAIGDRKTPKFAHSHGTNCDLCIKPKDEKKIPACRINWTYSSPIHYQTYQNSLQQQLVYHQMASSNHFPVNLYQTVQEIRGEAHCQYNSNGKPCRLCSILRTHMQPIKARNLDNSSSNQKNEVEEEVENQTIGFESKLNIINESPSKFVPERYLKLKNMEEHKKQAPPQPIKENRLSQLPSLVDKAIKKINPERTSPKKHHCCLTPAEEIKKYQNRLSKTWEIELTKARPKSMVDRSEKKTLTPSKTTPSPKAARVSREKTYSQLHGLKGSSKQTGPAHVDFGWVRSSLPYESKQKHFRCNTEEVYSFKKSPLSDLRLYELEVEARRWFEANRSSIEYQCSMIFSYDLIRKHMKGHEITEKIQKLVVEMVEPKYWLPLMVDDVYSRLRDKYRHEVY